MHVRFPITTAVAAVLATSALLPGCSGGTGKQSASGAAPTSPSTSASPPTSPPISAPTSLPRGKPADAATKRAVQRAYSALFGTTATLSQSLAALQHGSVFRAAVVAESKSPRAQRSGAKVTAVSIARANVADVAVTVISNGTPVLPTTGKAVRVNGHWQVAAQTFCSLLQLSGDAPQACGDPSVTALPH
jgi:hypothetical protein